MRRNLETRFCSSSERPLISDLPPYSRNFSGLALADALKGQFLTVFAIQIMHDKKRAVFDMKREDSSAKVVNISIVFLPEYEALPNTR